MSPNQAALEFIRLMATDARAAIRFAMQYENDAPPNDYADYLDILESE